MKKISQLPLAVLCSFHFLFFACNQKEDGPLPQDPVCTTLIAEENILYTAQGPPDSGKRVYHYNADKKLVRIEEFYDGVNTHYDTMIYNNRKELVSVLSYSTNTAVPQVTKNYVYTNGLITYINEVGTTSAGPYDLDWTFTYLSGVLTKVTAFDKTGSYLAIPDTISSIVFSDGNISSLDYGSLGGPATLTYETTAPNPYLGLNNLIDIGLMFNANNFTSGYLNSDPANSIDSRSYTYLNGRVHSITEDSVVTTLSYICR
jgi:hypothetical protein